MLSFRWRTCYNVITASSEHPARIRQALKHRDFGEEGGDGARAEFAGLPAFQPLAYQAGGVLSGCQGPQSRLLNVQLKILPCVLWSIPEGTARVGSSVAFSHVLAAKANTPL